MTARRVAALHDGLPATDGAGVELLRVIGQPELMQLDPFLLLDVFRSDDPQDYIAGFPAHPHRGFETVTYLLQGRMRHRDSAGHEGVIEAGGIQWMTAGSGILHSEMPEQQDGLLQGFQLWINLPAAHKMDPPRYQEFSAGQIPLERRQGSDIRVIAGKTRQGTRGPVQQPLTDPRYFDVSLQAGHPYHEELPPGHAAFLLVIEGRLRAKTDQGEPTWLERDRLAILGPGDRVELAAGDNPARFLLVAGRPLGEPVARGGPFVMNREAEIRQAFDDYRSGRMGRL